MLVTGDRDTGRNLDELVQEAKTALPLDEKATKHARWPKRPVVESLTVALVVLTGLLVTLAALLFLRRRSRRARGDRRGAT